MSFYRVSDKAKSDLKDIRDYLWDRGGRKIAARVLNDIRDSIILITDHPGIGHRRTDLSDDRARFYLVHRYLIIYRFDANRIEISRILHSARDVKKILED